MMASIRKVLGLLVVGAILAVATLPALAHSGAQTPPPATLVTNNPYHGDESRGMS